MLIPTNSCEKYEAINILFLNNAKEKFKEIFFFLKPSLTSPPPVNIFMIDIKNKFNRFNFEKENKQNKSKIDVLKWIIIERIWTLKRSPVISVSNDIPGINITIKIRAAYWKT